MALAVAGLTLLAFALRVHGLDHLLPHHPEMDSQVVLQTRAYCERGGWEPTERGLNDYPTLIARLAALGPAPAPVGSVERPAELPQHLAAASAYYLRVRWLVCLVSSALVPLSYFLARRFLSAGAAFAAALLVAVDPLHVLFSAQARPHGVLTTLGVLCLLSAIRMRSRPSATSYALAGGAVALALGALHSGLAFLPPLAFAHLRRDRTCGARSALVLIPLLIVTGGCAFFYRDVLLGMRATGLAGRVEGEVAQGGHHISWSMFDGGGFEQVARFLFGMNPVLGLLAVLGLLRIVPLFRRGRWRALLRGDAGVVLAFVLPYFLAIGIFAGTGERFTLPLLPCFALLAALWLEPLQRAASTRLGRVGARVALAGALLVALALPAATSAKLAWLRARPDTQEECAALLERSLPEGASVILQAGLDLPLYYPEEALYRPGSRVLRTATLWSRYQREVEPSRRAGRVLDIERLDYPRKDHIYGDEESVLARLRASPAEWVVLEVSGFFRALPAGRNFLAGVERWGRLTTRIRPDPFDEAFDRRLHYIYCEDFLRRVFSARALGPELRIYRRAKRDRPHTGS